MRKFRVYSLVFMVMIKIEGDFGTSILKYNPFGIKDEKGELMLFETWEGMYKYTIRKMSEWFGKGIVDVVLLVSKLTGISVMEAKVEVRQWRKQGFFDAYVFLDSPDGWVVEEDRTEYHRMVRLFEMLHSISGTRLDKMMFDNALTGFHKWKGGWGNRE